MFSSNSNDTEMLRKRDCYIADQIDSLECLINVAKMCLLDCVSFILCQFLPLKLVCQIQIIPLYAHYRGPGLLQTQFGKCG